MKKILLSIILLSSAGLMLNAMEEKREAPKISKERAEVNNAYNEIFYTRTYWTFDDAVNKYKKLLNTYFPGEKEKWLPAFRMMFSLNRQRPKPAPVVNGAPVFQQLPPELHEYIAQFLGNTVQETIKNIMNLAQVNKALYNQIVKDQFAIKRMLIQRFGEEGIARAFLDALETSTKLGQVKPFFGLHLISSEDMPLLNSIDPKWLKKLIFSEWATFRRHPAETPDPIREDQYKKYARKQPYEYIPLLIDYLINVGFFNLNKEYNGKTILHLAFKIGAHPLYTRLLGSGKIHLSNPVHKKGINYALKKFPGYFTFVLGIHGLELPKYNV